ncbi:arginase family protein [Ruegeria atlantica]|uniref:arginase family protein n=1 Tax=Ruegeria atlantica TaxID=81569 RepID=UPI00147E4CFD|nr:arginase family protein [Ruegeria atlantica]
MSYDLSDDGDLARAKQDTSKWYWWGIPTFFKCPHDENPSGADVVLVGVPHSSGNGSTERDQHLGPQAVRNVSGLYRRVHTDFGINPWNEKRIVDLGDVPLPEAMVNDVCVEHIEAFYKRIDKSGARPVSMGGDHSITGPILKAIAGRDAKTTGGQKAALIHFDAHTDSYDHLPHWLGVRRSAAHWGGYLAAEGHVDPSKSLQIGLRGHTGTLDWYEASKEHGYEIVPIKRFRELGVQGTIDLIRERAGDAPVYVTFDLDVLDPSIAPAASNLEVTQSGMSMTEVVTILQSMRGMNVIGGDVVCLIPSKDNRNKVTSFVAMAVMFELVSLVTDRLMSEE